MSSAAIPFSNDPAAAASEDVKEAEPQMGLPEPDVIPVFQKRAQAFVVRYTAAKFQVPVAFLGAFHIRFFVIIPGVICRMAKRVKIELVNLEKFVFQPQAEVVFRHLIKREVVGKLGYNAQPPVGVEIRPYAGSEALSL